jgi:hypothetical protein
VWTSHHIILDGWSNAIVRADLVAIYDALHAGRAPELPPVQQYREFMSWLAARDASSEEAYWRERLGGVPAATPLPLAAFAPERVNASSQIATSLPGLPALEQTARRLRTTVSTLVHVAWGLTLARYSGQDEVVFGTVVSGRSADVLGVDRIVGPLLNTLAVRIDVRRGERVGELVARVHRELVVAREHEHTPLSQVQRWSSVEPGAPLFHSLLAFENYPIDLVTQHQALVLRPQVIREQTNYPLSLLIAPGEQLAVLVQFDDRVLSRGQVEDVLDHFARLLEGLASSDPAVDGTAPPFGGAAGGAQVPAVDGTAPPFGGAAGGAQVPAVERSAGS